MVIPKLFKNFIEKFKLSFEWARKDSPSSKSLSKTKYIAKSGGQLIVQQGLSLPEVKDIINKVVDQKLVTVKKEAEETYKDRVKDFETKIVERLEELNPDELNKLREPDLQIVLSEAAVISGRKQDKDLRDTLSNLVIGRIKNCEEGREELKNIVYNEAIKTIEKLTIDQLKIITLCYLIRHSRSKAIYSWESFNYYLNNIIKPFLRFKESNAQYQHIQYTGCGHKETINFDLIMALSIQYAFLFNNPISESKIAKMNIPDNIRDNIFTKDTEEGNLYFRSMNNKELEDELKSITDDNNLIEMLKSLFINNLKNCKIENEKK